jgi:P-type conjugative transfer protein TrbJ
MKKITCTILAASIAFLPAVPTLNATAVVGATEPTQIMNNIELGGINLAEIDQLATQIQQLTTQIQQYETMLKNLVSMPFVEWGAVLDCFNSIKDLAKTAQGFAYTLGNLDEEFKAAHPDFESYISGGSSLKPADFAGQYKKWNSEVNDAAKMALKAAGITLDGVDKDAQLIDKLKTMSGNANGQLAAVQAGNQFSGLLNKQMIELRQIIATQNNAVNAYNAAQEAQEQAERAAEAKAFEIKTKAFKGTKRY